jgi:hypothetical protein
VLFSLFSRRKKLASPGAESAPELMGQTDVVETLPAAVVATAISSEVGDREPAARNTVDQEVAEPDVVEHEAAESQVAVPKNATRSPTGATPAREQPAVDDALRPAGIVDEPVDEVPADPTPPPPPPAPAVVRPPTVADLRAQAKALGLTGYSRLPKAELLRVIAEHHAK